MLKFDKTHYEKLTTDEKVNILLDWMEAVKETFPFGLEQHKQYHQKKSEQEKAEQAFFQDLKNTLIKTGIIGLLGILGSLILLGLYARLGQVLINGIS
jgi:hypothetical protein